MRVAIATFSEMPPEIPDDELLARALRGLGAAPGLVPWDDPDADWDAFDLVVIRSTWDYTPRRDAFVAWAESIGDRLHNAPGVVRWNSDKRYLAELGTAGFAVVETTYVDPGSPMPTLVGEVVVKPAVSAGAKDSGRFGEASHGRAHELIGAIHASGRTVMIQPYQHAVDRLGETAVVCIDGEVTHVLRKGAVLRPDEVAPVRDDALGAAEAMYEPHLVVPGEATHAELAFARRLVHHVADRFGCLPLYARVDLVDDGAGRPVLMELELIEPSLYFDQVPEAVEPLARAIVGRGD